MVVIGVVGCGGGFVLAVCVGGCGGGFVLVDLCWRFCVYGFVLVVL